MNLRGGGGAPESNTPCGFSGLFQKRHLIPQPARIFYKQFGFTLAEVLTTLGIIGIISSLTIPNLMGAYRKRVVETELKKSYSEFANVIQRAEADNEAAIYWEWPYKGGTQESFAKPTEEFFHRYFAPYMNITLEARTDHDYYKVYDSAGIATTIGTDTRNSSKWHELADGRAVLLNVYTTISGDLNNANKGTVGRFMVSTTNRGHQKFIAGKNLFSFTLQVKERNLVPTANAWPTWSCSVLDKRRDEFIKLCKSYSGASGVSSQEYCTFLIYCNNWKIPDDYPIKF